MNVYVWIHYQMVKRSVQQFVSAKWPHKLTKATVENFACIGSCCFDLLCIAFVVDQGSFAQRTTAPTIVGAVTIGETHQPATKWSGEDGIRTAGILLASLKAFFKDNPAWE